MQTFLGLTLATLSALLPGSAAGAVADSAPAFAPHIHLNASDAMGIASYVPAVAGSATAYDANPFASLNHYDSPARSRVPLDSQSAQEPASYASAQTPTVPSQSSNPATTFADPATTEYTYDSPLPCADLATDPHSQPATYHYVRGPPPAKFATILVPKRLTTSVSSGTEIVATPGKTTTILGRWDPDMQHVVPEVTGGLKSWDFGAKPGGFNVLNVPDGVER